MKGQHSFLESIVVPSRVVFLMWLLFFISENYDIDFGFLGVSPRSVTGLIGIVTMPLVHGNVYHISSNTVPVLILGGMLFYFYPRMSKIVFFQCYFFTNVLVWIFGKYAIHIGASGLIYGLAAFLILIGFLRKDLKSLFISAAVIIIYGSIFFQMIPSNPRVSWESHLMGAVVGAVNAYVLRKKRST